ncbi:MAG: protein-glutamate methylesterase/protein-glutamine glutaminase [Candidatus Geothermincolia bacterium]
MPVGKTIKVLIVDDSILVRKLLSDIIDAEPGMQVIGSAANGVECIKAVQELDPDVVTLDVHMPEMDGLAALEFIMQRHPRPVLMLSAMTSRGASTTMRALELGAVDFIAKPAYVPGQLEVMRGEITRKIRVAAAAHVTPPRPRAPRRIRPASRLPRTDAGLVVIGASAGGPRALAAIMPDLPAAIPAAIVVVQHMPPLFTRSFAERLNSRSGITVREAAAGDALRNGEALVVPGGQDLIVKSGNGARPHIHLKEHAGSGASPQIDMTMVSAVAAFGTRTIGVLLTGMGSDGALGMRAIKDGAGKTVVQDEATSLVFGMPKAAIERDAVDWVVPLADIPETIMRMLDES